VKRAQGLRHRPVTRETGSVCLTWDGAVRFARSADRVALGVSLTRESILRQQPTHTQVE
jgi:hypothetical protein